MFRVIYVFGDTEVESIRTFPTYDEAQAEVRAARDEADGDEKADLAWVEPVNAN